MKKHEKFSSAILKHSLENKRLLVACGEWSLIGIIIGRKNKCECGHDIKNTYIIQNINTLKTLKMGSVHIKFFDDLKPNTIVRCLKKINENIYTHPNPSLIRYAVERGILFEKEGGEKESDFLFTIFRKRKVSKKDNERIKAINLRILKSVSEQTN